ncbi:MAG: translation initiation factor IF-3 [Candidatus Paceibacterota bacterium]
MSSNYRPRFNPATVTNDLHRINHRIKVPQVRVISESGEQLGIISTREAIERAEGIGLDLVEVAPKAAPPVCKIMDYGKFKYREQKKEADSKKKRSEVVIKELRIRYTTDKGDFNTKIERARGFLLKGDKVKFSMLFKGREIAFMERGIEKFKEVAISLEDIADIDSQSPKPGKQIFVIFTPKVSKKNE